ncbi:carbohydrate-selective porin OprB (plasmid) [Leptolyngbya sp. NIES-3755]|nr:carbohydrate-selective porin OprB [Leptolyngbya sp. NIES-3755]
MIRKSFIGSTGVGSLVFSASLLLSSGSFAAEVSSTQLGANKSDAIVENSIDSLTTVSQSSEKIADDSLSQVTSVSQLSDVRPTDWAFQALQSLVERYGCIAGYPDKTYRGNRALTRYEFAAGLNACLDRVNELIAAATADLVKKEDLATLQKLQEEFAAELATLRGRVDALEARTTTLEKQQFSTTTKLAGEAIFALADVFGDRAADNTLSSTDNPNLNANTMLVNRVRLSLNTSFNGRDLLFTRLNAGNTPNLAGVTGTNMARLSYESGVNNQLGVDKLYYRFPASENLTAYVGTTGLESAVDLIFPLNRAFESTGTGAISRFGRFNPIYRQAVGAGAGLTYSFSRSASLSLAYLAGDASDPSASRGLFGGSYGAIAQLTLRPTEALGINLLYVNSYNRLNVGVGSTFANAPFGSGVAASANSFGAEVSYRLSPRLILGGEVGWVLANAESSSALAPRGSDATIFNWAATLSLPDLGRKGNLAGLVIGQQPKVIRNDIAAREDFDTSLHLEAFYRLALSDKISVTPGVIVITNPEHNASNDTIYVGTIRTTFRF